MPRLVEIELRGPVALVTLARPREGNPPTIEACVALHDALVALLEGRRPAFKGR